MISRRTLTEMFIETLTEMLREDRKRRASRLSRPMPAQARRVVHHLPFEGHDGVVAVDLFPKMHMLSRSYGERQRPDLSSLSMSRGRDLTE